MTRKGFMLLTGEELNSLDSSIGDAFAQADTFQTFPNCDFANHADGGTTGMGGIYNETDDRLDMVYANEPASGLPNTGLLLRSGGVEWATGTDMEIFLENNWANSASVWTTWTLHSFLLLFYDVDNIAMAGDYTDFTSRVVLFIQTQNAMTLNLDWTIHVPHTLIPSGAAAIAIRARVQSASALTNAAATTLTNARIRIREVYPLGKRR